jgi:hypothetical protein
VAADCGAFLSGLVAPGELGSTVQRSCDGIIAAALAFNIAEAGAAASMEAAEADDDGGGGGDASLGAALALVAAASAVVDAVTAAWAGGECGNAESAAPLDGDKVESSAQLQGILASTEEAAGRAAAAAAAPALAQCAALEWTLESRPRTGGACSPQFERLLGVLQAQQAQVAAAPLPPPCARRVMAAVLRSVAEDLMRLLASDAVPTFTVFGVQRLLSDLSSLTRFAEQAAGDGGPHAVAEPVMFCELVAFGGVEELLDGAVRRGKFAALDADRCAALLLKLRDPGGRPPAAGGTRLLSRAAAAAAAGRLREALAQDEEVDPSY